MIRLRNRSGVFPVNHDGREGALRPIGRACREEPLGQYTEPLGQYTDYVAGPAGKGEQLGDGTGAGDDEPCAVRVGLVADGRVGEGGAGQAGELELAAVRGSGVGTDGRPWAQRGERGDVVESGEP